MGSLKANYNDSGVRFEGDLTDASIAQLIPLKPIGIPQS